MASRFGKVFENDRSKVMYRVAASTRVTVTRGLFNRSLSVPGSTVRRCPLVFGTMQKSFFSPNFVRWYSSPSEKTVVVPGMGDSITEGRIFEWSKKEGEPCKTDDVVVIIETDKIRVDVRAPGDGSVTKTYVNVGDDVRIGQDLFVFKLGAEDTSGRSAEPPKQSSAEPPKPSSAEPPKQSSTEPPKPSSAEPPKPSSAEPPKQSSAEPPKPSSAEPPKPSSAEPPKPSATSPPKVPSGTTGGQPGSREERREKMTKMRQRIAARLKESQNSTAMLTTFNEVDMFHIMELRNKYKDVFEKKHGAKLGFMSAFVRASSLALKEVPIVNAVIDGDSILYRAYHDISVAVATPGGLVVPVLRNVEGMSFADIERAIQAFAKKARDNALAIEDMVGGTFTISNGGVYGSLFGTPIINPPQSAILGMHTITQRAHVVGEEIKIRPVMFVALTYDHRLIDGREAVLFLKKIKSCIEEPESMLLDV